MTFKDILVYLDDDAGADRVLGAALSLASKYEAHVTGLHVIPSLQMYGYADVYIPPSVMENQLASAKELSNTLRSKFESACSHAGCIGEMHVAEGFADTEICKRSLHTDLLVIGQDEDPGVLSGKSATIDHVVVDSARPVMVVPYIHDGAIEARRILVAWNGSRESARAVADALPLLKDAELVNVLAINPPKGEELPVFDICDHLARHGVRAEGGTTAAENIDVANILLSRAADLSSDLIVLGAYGHTRFRESVLGGVTHDILKSMTVPVLMAH